MRTCVLAGGVGSARFLTGLVRVCDPGEVTVVVNTGDDERIRGLHISPDIDTVLYHLADVTEWDRGWGITGESFVANGRYAELASALADEGVDLQEWFGLGDRDLATHMLRARLLDLGWTLTAATDAVRRAMGIAVRVVPMSDDRVATVLVTADGTELDFQTYFVRRRHADALASIEYRGVGAARPSAIFAEALEGADLILIPPSNPLLSVGPILALPGVRDAVAAKRTVAVSPLVGGRAIKGPTEEVLVSFGHEPTAVGVARYYEGLIDVFVLDRTDEASAPEIEAMGIEPLLADTIMSGPDASARLSKEILASVG